VQKPPGPSRGANDFRPSPIFGWGCGSLLASVVVGAIAWYIAYGLSPDPCSGSPGPCSPEPDAEFYWMMNTFPAGLIAFLLTQLLLTVLLIRHARKGRP
jgi:hypothetical protein